MTNINILTPWYNNDCDPIVYINKINNTINNILQINIKLTFKEITKNSFWENVLITNIKYNKKNFIKKIKWLLLNSVILNHFNIFFNQKWEFHTGNNAHIVYQYIKEENINNQILSMLISFLLYIKEQDIIITNMKENI